jgi:CRISPR-associated endonuclease/helicase Cas3
LILDEVQTLPIEYLHPIVDTLDTLKRIFNVSILFTTASLPILYGKIEGVNPFVSFEALPQINEIIPEGATLHDRLRRVRLDIDNTKQSYDDIVDKISKHSRVLCIVNTRKDAKEIYSRLPKEGLCFHLSRMMCPTHVRKVIDEIKEALQNDSNTIIRVVATQLIEAGVDIDFPVVFRQEAGLDSILQAAGRCNREGRLDICTTHVFSLQNKLPLGYITQTNNARLAMVGEYDWFSPDAMRKYFKQLHSRIETFDKPRIYELLYQKNMQFETAANEFHLIDDNTTSVIVNWEDSAILVDKLCSEAFSYSLMKKLAQYSINVRERDLKKLSEAGAIEELLEGVLFIRDTGFYDDHIGLNTENHWLEEPLIK